MAASYKPIVAIVRVLGALLSVAMIALNGLFLYYMDQLEHSGCKCANNWRRSFAEGTLALFVILGLVSLFGYTVTNPWVRMLTLLLYVAYVVITRQFIHMVKSKNCSCAESKTLTVLNIVNYVQIALLCFGLLEVVILVGASMAQPTAAVSPPSAVRGRRRS